MPHFPYSIPTRRALTDQERTIVQLLLPPERKNEAALLEVFARCGCGQCPTIIFHPGSEEKSKAHIIADHQGGSTKTGLVGIILWERDNQISELEAWSIDGKNVTSWPPLDTIRPINISSS